MAPTKNAMNPFCVYILETYKSLLDQGIQENLNYMDEYCKKDWEKMPDHIKHKYKMKARKILADGVDWMALIGKNIDDYQKVTDRSNLFDDSMYPYIEELVHIEPLHFFIPKQKFIFVHINSYSCEKNQYYFPAEITLAEFSLEKGFIRSFHELLGIDKNRTFTTLAQTADINVHAKNNHRITTFMTLRRDYKATFFKLISFILGQEVDETAFNDPTFDLPPIYRSHNSEDHYLTSTTASLYQLYKSAISYAPMTMDDFSKILKVYHLEKLLMEIKNTASSLVKPDSYQNTLPSVALTSEHLAKSMFSTILTIGCSFHEEIKMFHVCSNYYVCKWIHIFSSHCCHYFKIKLQPGCHYDFDLSKTEDKYILDVIKTINNIEISNNYDCKYQKQQKDSLNNEFPFSGGRSPVVLQSPWFTQNIINQLFVPNNGYNFPPLSSSQKTIPVKISTVNSCHQNTRRERDSEVKNNKNVQFGNILKKSAEKSYDVQK